MPALFILIYKTEVFYDMPSKHLLKIINLNHCFISLIIW